METSDICVIGAGIVGLATAWRATQRFPSRSVLVLEKEPEVAQHQTGRNSGVLHSGVYYQPGSLKATNCRAGKLAMEAFCRDQGVPYETCGKVIVAVSEKELPALERIRARAVANGVSCRTLSKSELHEVEPHAAGIQALHVPETGIVDYSLVCRRLAELVTQSRGRVHTNARVVEIHRDNGRFVLETPAGRFLARTVVNCAGLHSDRVTAMSGQQPTARIVPFRGEYYELTAEARPLCRNLIYPVPDPQFPFLGVHFTRMIGGGVECGPNAVLAFAREGYRKTDVNLRDLWSIVSYGGFLRLAVRYFRTGVGEMVRSCFKRAFVTALQRLVPEIQPQHLVPGKAGVRAQAVAADGTMVDDFLIQQNGAMINVGNAPSPAATSALNIGDLIVDKLPQKLD